MRAQGRRSRTRPRRCSRSGETRQSAPATRASRDAHEGQRRGFGRDACHDRGRGRALQRQQRAVFQRGHRRRPAPIWAKSTALRLAFTTRNKPSSPRLRDHQIVEDAARLVGQQRVALPPRLQADDVAAAPAAPARPRRRAGSIAWPMCDTSNSAACARQCRCSAITPPLQRAARSPVKSYCTGMA